MLRRFPKSSRQSSGKIADLHGRTSPSAFEEGRRADDVPTAELDRESRAGVGKLRILRAELALQEIIKRPYQTVLTKQS